MVQVFVITEGKRMTKAAKSKKSPKKKSSKTLIKKVVAAKESDSHRQRFEQLLDDAAVGIKPAK
jgi:hypothetical protein